MIELFLRYSVSLCEKTAYDILFTLDKLGILMQFSCYHMPYVSNNVQIGALRRPIQGENIIFNPGTPSRSLKHARKHYLAEKFRYGSQNTMVGMV